MKLPSLPRICNVKTIAIDAIDEVHSTFPSRAIYAGDFIKNRAAQQVLTPFLYNRDRILS
jgi:hypothetical protein